MAKKQQPEQQAIVFPEDKKGREGAKKARTPASRKVEEKISKASPASDRKRTAAPESHRTAAPAPAADGTAKYDNNSIKSLKGADRVRKRPAVIFGSDGLEGCEHAFFEILSNAVDEAREGNGDVITVTTWQDRSITVDDHGRGVPLGFNEAEGRWNWDLIYCEMYAGGKYENNSGSAAYEYSLGLNGLGACATQYSSDFMDVYSYDGTQEHSIHFAHGEVCSELVTRTLPPNQRRTGTVVHWRADLAVFTDINIPPEFFEETLHRQSVVNAGVRFVLRVEKEDGSFDTHDYYYPNGISDYLAEKVGDAAMTQPVRWHMESRGRDREDKEEYRFKADIAFCISNTCRMLEYYHNSSFLEHGGSPDQAVRLAFVYALDRYLKNNGKYTKNESRITFADVADCLVLVINSFSTMTSYENQTKKSITNSFIKTSLYEYLKGQLEIYFIENPVAADTFAAQVLVNKRSRESAESARVNLKKKLSANMDISNRVEKFVNCRSKDPSRRELYIVEGDSALTSVKLARDSEFQAVIPVRGKTLNCMKATYEQIFKNDIITDLLRVIGCGVELSGKKAHTDMATFDLSALRWSKIIICTDADEDGFQIRTLLLTLFYRLLPTLLREHKVFIAETPLFEITTKDKTYFAYDETEKISILKKLEGKKYTIQRSKGLGENEADMMSLTTMKPSSRRLISITPADPAKTEEIFDILLGNNLAARKEFIAQYGSLYLKDADI